MRPSYRGVVALCLAVLGLTAGLTSCRRPPTRPPTTTRPSTTTGPTTPSTTSTTRPATTTTLPGSVTPTKVKVVYGPWDVPAAANGEMGMLENKIALNVKRPCTDCYITSMQADLEDTAGKSQNIADGVWLHHMVMFDSSKQDLTCPGRGPGLLGQRFFSSGNERSPVSAQGPFGYPQGTNSTWNLIYDLMNMTKDVRRVAISVTYEYVPLSTPGIKPMTPLWLDIDQCADSEVLAKTGAYTYSYALTSKWTGKMIGIGGHLHDGGTHLTISNNGKVVCDSKATYGGTPAYIEGSSSTHMPGMGHISDMSRCHGTEANPVTSIAPGDTIELVAYYDSNAHMQMGDHPVMGIAIGYFAMS